ncbi:MAG: tyrosine-protein phosphatase, partial [Pyrinomonadaceae bacterium]
MKRMPASSLRSTVGISLSILLLSIVSFAQTAPKVEFKQIKIKNFGQMDERFFRGAQPKKIEDYQALAALGIKTVIDLRDDPEDYEKPAVESLGMRYVNIPMIGKKYPKAESVEQFLKLVDNPETGKFFVHCAGGRHRTGAMGAVYRFKHYGWNFDQVYKEMKDYDFYTSWGHGDFKKFVEDYWQQVQANHAANPTGKAT